MLVLGELSLHWWGMVRVWEGDGMLWERGRGARKVRGREHRGLKTPRGRRTRGAQLTTPAWGVDTSIEP